MTGLNLKVKRMFFDRKLVEDILGKASAKALGKAGAHVRTRARSLLRRRKAISTPGSPPSVHSNDDVASLKNIWFALDPNTLNVVVGPLRLNQVNLLAGGGTVTVPELHEMGGTLAILEQQYKGSTKSQRIFSSFLYPWRRSDLRRSKRPWYRYRVRQASYPKRPFMLPALQAEAPNFPSLWFNAAGAAA